MNLARQTRPSSPPANRWSEPMCKFPLWLTLTMTFSILFASMHAEQNPETSPHALAGTWELLRAEIVQSDGKISVDPNYGSQAKGLLLVDYRGRYSLQVFRPDRPRFASGDKARGTPEEYKAALLGLSTHTGRISVDEVNHRLIFHLELAAFPNWEHTDQTRTYQLSNDELSYRIPPRPDGTSAISVWRRTTGTIQSDSHSR
jgi:hypothetical protein